MGINSDGDPLDRLGVTLSLLDVNMTRLAALAQKEESKAANSQNLRHGSQL